MASVAGMVDDVRHGAIYARDGILVPLVGGGCAVELMGFGTAPASGRRGFYCIVHHGYV